MKPQVEIHDLHHALAHTEGEMGNWVPMEQPNNKQAHALATQLEKMRLDMELTMTRYRYEDNEKQWQHEEKMEAMRQQALSLTQPSGGAHHFLLPQDQFTLFLYCFIFIHVIYIAKELVFFFIKKHEMVAIGAILICAIKTFWK
ncbi:transmembrane protein 247-like [Rhineura floridana]|uniref:transmembrane protein 247-like n=1 Tax=Rhineura floridana TaxID=261503 RepID=UPI002AC82642|nr:transmembrane protein 247-like [Rhineura floridana]